MTQPPDGTTLDAIIKEPASTANACIIWLHGLGADGSDFAGIVPQLKLPETLAIRFIFPHAPLRPVTINQGYVMRAWYDIVDAGFQRDEDEQGIHQSADQINELIEIEISKGIDASKIILAGFSQGGAIVLQTALRYPQRLGGVMALSCYLPLTESLVAEQAIVNKGIPIMMAHGTEDAIVPIALAEQSRQILTGAGYQVNWHDYPMAHAICPEEITAISTWITNKYTA